MMAASRTAFAWIDDWLAFHAAEDDIPGFAVTVVQNGEVVLNNGYGFADVEGTIPVTPQTQWGIGSQSKMITATAVLQLHEQGKLSIQEPLAKYLSWLTQHDDKRASHITIEQVLRHGAGWARDGSQSDFWQLEHPFPDEAALRKLVLSSSLVIDRGTGFKYSNLGYALLGCVIEAVSGQSFNDYINQNVLPPSPATGASYAVGYGGLMRHKRSAVRSRVDAKTLTPASGVAATPESMCTFVMSILPSSASDVLSPSSKNMLVRGTQGHWKPHRSGGLDYGLGIARYELCDRQFIGHDGGFMGHRSMTCISNDGALAISICANAYDAPIQTMLEGILSLIGYFETYGPPSDSPTLRALSGRYYNRWSCLQIIATNQKIIAIHPHHWLPLEDIMEELIPTAPATYRIRCTDNLTYDGETMTVQYDDNGRITHIINAGHTFHPEKIFFKDQDRLVSNGSNLL